MEAGTDVDSVTDLLALRLSSVPFHDIERPRSEDRRMSEEEARFPSETLASERWLPQLATISFVGPITSIQAALGFFATKIPLLLPSSASHSAEASDLFALGLLLLPSSLVVGTLPQDLQQSSSNWLISGEICLINKEITVVAQSVYQQQHPPQAGQHTTTTISQASQVSFTGYMSRLIPVNPPVWSYTHSAQKKKKRDYSSLKGAMEAILEHQEDCEYEEAGWLDGVEIQEEMRLGQLEWLDISVHLQCLSYTPSDHHPSSWSSPSSELVSFKCRPAKSTNNDQLDSRLVKYATTLPLVGQLVAIHHPDPSSNSFDQSTSFFIQL